MHSGSHFTLARSTWLQYVDPQLGTDYCLPLSRQCAVNPRDKAKRVAAALQPGGEPPMSIRLHWKGLPGSRAADKASSSVTCVLCGAYSGDTRRAETSPTRTGNRRAPRLAWCSAHREALIERRKRGPRLKALELCFKLRSADGWSAGRTEFRKPPSACHPERSQTIPLPGTHDA